MSFLAFLDKFALPRFRKASPVSEIRRLPKCLLDDLIHSMMATGNFGRMASDAMTAARNRRDEASIELYRNMLGQVSDYWAQRAQ